MDRWTVILLAIGAVNVAVQGWCAYESWRLRKLRKQIEKNPQIIASWKDDFPGAVPRRTFES